MLTKTRWVRRTSVMIALMSGAMLVLLSSLGYAAIHRWLPGESEMLSGGWTPPQPEPAMLTLEGAFIKQPAPIEWNGMRFTPRPVRVGRE
jgi:hypothetical protein